VIKLEYDVNTSGTRVSFVVRDNDCSIQAVYDALDELAQDSNSEWKVPQNKKTLGLVAILIKQLEDSE
jgi:hypothetical protein